MSNNWANSNFVIPVKNGNPLFSRGAGYPPEPVLECSNRGAGMTDNLIFNTSSVPTIIHSTGGEKYERLSEYKVEAYESVTVPAGTFHAFKITVITETTDIRSNKAPDKDQYWYCPEIKYIIKRINWKGDIWELQSYNVK